MGTDDAELFSLFSTHLSVHSGLDLLHRSFDAFGEVWAHIKGFAAFQQPGRDGGSRLAKDIGKYIVQFYVGNGQAVLGTVLFPCGEAGQFPIVAHQVPKLPNLSRRDKTAGYQIVLKDVGDPFGIFLNRFLSPDHLDILGVGQDDGAGSFQNVVNRNPILPRGFHAHIPTVVFSQPCGASPQFIGEGGKPLAFVGGNSLLIGCGNTRYDKTFVDINPTTNGVDNFEHSTSPQIFYSRKTGRDWTLTERLK